jgi:DNA polymerase-1
VGDFAGLEARLGAHFSGDEVMLDIFRNGKDLYGTLAARAWGGPESKENPGRGLMKVVWLGSQYGAQGQTLADTMAIAGMHGYTARKADALLRELKLTCPRLFEWRDEVIEEARFHGYVVTLAGRKRHLPDIDSADVEAHGPGRAPGRQLQGAGLGGRRRAAGHAQGARGRGPDEAAICLQVHDEILWRSGPRWDARLFPELVGLCQTRTGSSSTSRSSSRPRWPRAGRPRSRASFQVVGRCVRAPGRGLVAA